MGGCGLCRILEVEFDFGSGFGRVAGRIKKRRLENEKRGMEG